MPRIIMVPSPLGDMIACATEKGLCALEFADSQAPGDQLGKIEKVFREKLVPGDCGHLEALRRELDEYFSGRRKSFDVELDIRGTDFQNQAWKVLLGIPYGRTMSYREQAMAAGRPRAVRAVANANGQNRISIIIPCHRVIGTDGSLTGYGSGLWRKQYLRTEARHSRPHPPRRAE
jgi:AraC family transcriptional regulator of adaptative response/methylated-DNA-[protein]-cysteine methyltransferase